MSEILHGINSVLEALKNQRSISRIYIARDKVDNRLGLIEQLAQEQNTIIKRTDKGTLDRLAGTPNHQGIAAEARRFDYSSVEEILQEAKNRGEPPFLVILDGIQDPQNLGAILRTCECLGVHGVVIPKNGACEVTPAVVRASAGASEHIKIARVTNLVNTIKDLKKQGIWAVGTDSQAPATCFDMVFPESVVLVTGGEGRGIRRLVGENCDYMVSIPMKGRVNSLNASVSCGIVLAQIVRQGREAARTNG